MLPAEMGEVRGRLRDSRRDLVCFKVHICQKDGQEGLYSDETYHLDTRTTADCIGTPVVVDDDDDGGGEMAALAAEAHSLLQNIHCIRTRTLA